MSARAEELASQFAQTNEEFISFISGMTEEDWLTVCPDEERTVAALAFHVAGGYAFELRAFAGIANGDEQPVVTREYLDRLNAEAGARYANADRAATIERLQTDGRTAADFVRSLSDEQLQRVGAYIDWVPPMSIEKWIEFILIGHIRMHRASMEAVLNQQQHPTA